MGNERERIEAGIYATLKAVRKHDYSCEIIERIASDWDMFDDGETSFDRHILEVARRLLREEKEHGQQAK